MADKQAHIFAQITKVDASQRLVFGRACQEVPDPSGEIFDYASSKPFFEKWSKETSDVTAGKSLGNVRAMHEAIAAGKVTELTFHDDERAIDMCTKVVDDNEWNKVLEGVYTGFSIGGSYEKRWQDGELVRYTANPIEVSLVDKPMIPTALFFDVVKADGAVMRKAFKSTPTNPEMLQALSDAKIAVDPNSPDDIVKRYSELMAKSPAAGTSSAALESQADDAGGSPASPVAKSAVPAPQDPVLESEAQPTEYLVTGTDDEVAELAKTMHDSKLDMGKVLGIIKAAITPPAEKMFADAVNKKYPLDNDAQILAAWKFSHTPAAKAAYTEPELSLIQDNISKAWEAKHDEQLKAEKVSAVEALGKAVEPVALAKGFWTTSWLASLISSFADFTSEVYWEAEYEEDGSALPGQVRDLLASMAAVLVAMVTEETSEADAGQMAMASSPSMKKLAAAVPDVAKYSGVRKAAIAKALTDYAATLSPVAVVIDESKVDLVALQKALTEMSAKVIKLEQAPQPHRAILKVVAPADQQPAPQGVAQTTSVEFNTEDIVKVNGQPDLAASLIKQIHRTAAQPATMSKPS